MKKHEDYTAVVIRLRNYLDAGSGTGLDHLVLRMEESLAKETPALYELKDGRRIKKSSLGKPVSLNNDYPMFEMHCLPKDLPQAKELMVKAMREKTAALISKLRRLEAQISNHTVVMDADQYNDFIFSQAGSSRRAIRDSSDPEPGA